MARQELIPSKWYKFNPYSGEKDKDKVWCLQYSHGSYGCSQYFGMYSGSGSGLAMGRGGNFSDYPSGFTELTPNEAAWAENCMREGKILPFDPQNYDVVINNYPLY